jgi:hypothetical protein
MTEREKIIRFFADVHEIACAQPDLETRFRITPIDYGNQGWLQISLGTKVLGEVWGNHPRIFFHP